MDPEGRSLLPQPPMIQLKISAILSQARGPWTQRSRALEQKNSPTKGYQGGGGFHSIGGYRLLQKDNKTR